MSLINLCAAARNAVSDWRRRQRAYAELTALDDRSLADIGIHRSQIPAIVEGMHRATGRGAAPARDGRPAPHGARLIRGH